MREAFGSILLVGIPLAVPLLLWSLGWTTAAVVTGVLAGLWLAILGGLWLVMSSEGRKDKKERRRTARAEASHQGPPSADDGSHR